MKKKVVKKEFGKLVIEVTCTCGCKDTVTVMNTFRKHYEKQK